MKKALSTLLALVMLATTILAVPFSASAMTASDASSAKAATASATKFTDNNVSIDVEDGYLYYKITVAESAVYSLYTEEVDGADTRGYLYSSSDLENEIAENDDGDYFETYDFCIDFYLEKGKTYYLAVRYYDNDDIGMKFNFVIEKSTTTVGYGGVLYTKKSVVIGKDEEGNDIKQDIYYVSGNYLSQPTAVTVKGSINSIPVNYIHEDAFEKCQYITSITIEDGVEYIDDEAFYGCTGLSSVRLPSTLKEIGDWAFENTSIKAITIPASVESMDDAFREALMLESITVNSANSNYKSVNGVLFTKDGKTLVQYPTGKIAEFYAIPDGVETVGTGAFYYVAVDKVTLSSTVKTIADNAFRSFKGKTVELNEGLESIGESAFAYSIIKTIKLPSTLKTVDNDAFYYTKMESVNIPASVTSIGGGSFSSYYLDAAIINNDSVTIADNAFTTNTTLFGNTGSTAEAYASSNGNNFVELSTTECTSNHMYVIDEYILEPTCQSKGKVSTYCAVCGKAGPEFEIEKLYHDYYNGVCAMCFTSEYANFELKLNGSVTGSFTSSGCANVFYKVEKDGKYTISLDSASQLVDWDIDAVHSNGQGYLYNWGYDGTKGSLTVNAKAGDVLMLYFESSDSVDENISFTASVKCEHAATKTTTTKATTKADGKIVKKCTVCGKTVSTTVIPKISSVKLSATSYTYNGKVKTPAVTVKDSKGKTLVKNTDYTVSYASGRKSVGKYAVKITFKGKYSGTKTLYFYVKPKGTSVTSVSAKSKGFTVKWSKQATQTTGYQIQYSTSSKFSNAKTVTISKNSTTSKTVSGLSAKKKYYVRVRTYKTVKINGKATKIYSGWSKAKYVTTKA
ncbi:MAG: leucine-rich repeat protein [Eubacterium sp.]